MPYYAMMPYIKNKKQKISTFMEKLQGENTKSNSIILNASLHPFNPSVPFRSNG